MRVVTLLPSATEIVAALGGPGLIVGRSHECDFPAEIADRPVLTAARVPLGLDAGAIDMAVKEASQTGQAMYEVDAAQLRALAPDVIVTQAQCEVCAVSEDDLIAVLATWPDAERPRLATLNARTLAGVAADITRVGEALGLEAAAARVNEEMAAGFAALDGQQAEGVRPRVLTLDWLDPLMAAGDWMGELVEIAGGERVLSDPGGRYPELSLAQIEEADPDIIVAMPCGFGLERTLADTQAFAEGANRLRAVREGRLYAVDGNAFFNRPGPRLKESAQILAEIIAPARHDFGLRGSAWVALNEAP